MHRVHHQSRDLLLQRDAFRSEEVFREQLGRTVSTYVDDIVVKSRRREDHLGDLEEVFRVLRKNGISLKTVIFLKE